MTVEKVLTEFFDQRQPEIAAIIAWCNSYPSKPNEQMVDKFLKDILKRGYDSLCADVLFAIEHEKKDGGKE